MAYIFETAEKSGIFIARVGGVRHESRAENFDELWAFWRGVASEMKQRELRRLLAVVSTEGSLRSLGTRNFYRRLGEMGFMANMRLAVVLEVPIHERPVIQLGVNAASLDGWTICHFAAEAEAVAWLERGI